MLRSGSVIFRISGYPCFSREPELFSTPPHAASASQDIHVDAEEVHVVAGATDLALIERRHLYEDVAEDIAEVVAEVVDVEHVHEVFDVDHAHEIAELEEVDVVAEVDKISDLDVDEHIGRVCCRWRCRCTRSARARCTSIVTDYWAGDFSELICT